MNVLSRILDHKRREIEACNAGRSDQAARPAAPPRRDFRSAIAGPGVSVIAEIKRQSPARGVICESFDVAETARAYQMGGAAAISVLTDKRFFGGSADDLATAKSSASLPVLRKDFIVDASQIVESACLGADAVLLIVAAMTDERLVEFIALARRSNLAALVEVHGEGELQRAIRTGADIIGVNNRDLTTMTVDLNVCLNLREYIPRHCLAVAESGVRSREDVTRLAAAGYDAVLVGEALMAAGDPSDKLRELIGRPPQMPDPIHNLAAMEFQP